MGQLLDHIGADILDLFRGKCTTERRHRIQSPAHLLHDGSQIRGGRQRQSTPMAAFTLRAVAEGTGTVVQDPAVRGIGGPARHRPRSGERRRLGDLVHGAFE